MDAFSALLDKYGDPSVAVSDTLDMLKASKVLVSLQGCGVEAAGEESKLATVMLPRLTELDLSRNSLTWNEVLKLLSHANLPRLAVLNVGFNPLVSISLPAAGIPCISTLTTLVLDGCGVPFEDVLRFVSRCPRISELSLSDLGCPRFGHVGDDPVWLPSVTTVRLSNNTIGDWKEVIMIGMMFPSLTTLVLSGNPLPNMLPELRDIFVANFSHLRSLNLANTSIDRFDTVQVLGRLSSLRDIRLSNCPFPPAEPDELRMLLIAQLPNVSSGGAGLQTVGSETAGLLNGSAVTRLERRGGCECGPVTRCEVMW
jgi:Leucine-rich repeat (LRR) protein